MSATEEKGRAEYPKADMVHRAVGRSVDFLIVLVVMAILPRSVSGLVAVAYLLLADGFFEGQSPGKRIGGVKVVNRRTRRGAIHRESIIRNLPFAILLPLWYIPLVGWIIMGLMGLFVVIFELFMAWSDKLGLRIGDVLAETQVVDASIPIEGEAPVLRKQEAPTT